jgi:putative oxidoreductase
MNRPDTTFIASASTSASPAAALDRFAPVVLSILRIMTGLLFLQHGMSKLFGYPQPGHMPAFLTLLWFAGIIEFGGSILVALGLFTRAAAFIMSGEMAFAYFMSHAPRSPFPILNGGESAIFFCFVFLYLVFAGAGPLSLDAWLWRRKE